MNNTEMGKLCKKLSEHLLDYTIRQINCVGSGSLEIVATKDNRQKFIRLGVSPDGLYLSKVHAENI